MSETKTLGERRVRTEFNPSAISAVDIINQKTAELINLLEGLKNDEVSETYDRSPEQLKAQSGEKLRLIAIAQTDLEKAAMVAAKAATA